MRRRWYYFRRAARQNMIILPAFFAVLACFFVFWTGRDLFGGGIDGFLNRYGVRIGGSVLKAFVPALAEPEETGAGSWLTRRSVLLEELTGLKEDEWTLEDPAYEKILVERMGEKRTGRNGGARAPADGSLGSMGGGPGESGGASEDKVRSEAEDGGMIADYEKSGEVIAIKPADGAVVMEKLADYDYMMQSFYSVHPTTTAGRELMNASRFLQMDFTLEKNSESPQILIYHTHSQEEFADYPENPDATIIKVGTYLTELLEKKGYRVIHDTTVYDLKDGKLDRSQAYTYALDGISGILQKNPAIEVVIDVHRDGVKEGTRLVTEIDGRPTAQIMFFNGLSQTPDGPIEYLPNPNREGNLGFSFQLQLAASRRYPGFTRKIYLKGLRYNEHVRARSLLVEVGAQTNTYEEAKNAMLPLSEILDEVLGG